MVCLKNDGNKEYLKDGFNCLFYEEGNVLDGAKKVEELVANEALRKELLSHYNETIQPRVWKRLEKSILSLYDISI